MISAIFEKWSHSELILSASNSGSSMEVIRHKFQSNYTMVFNNFEYVRWISPFITYNKQNYWGLQQQIWYIDNNIKIWNKNCI